MSQEIHVLRPHRVHNRTFHLAGMAILAANGMRHRIQGYRTPRPEPVRSAAAALEYDAAVVENWMTHLQRYLRQPPRLEGKRALEIGPGPDLGTGLLLLARGMADYCAVDVHPLVRRTPAQRHLELAEKVAQHTGADPQTLVEEITSLQRGEPRRLHYSTGRGLDLGGLGDQTFDFVLSHAVLEHLGDFAALCQQLARVCRPGALFAAEIDLQTHSRWIRDADPLNIYRYSDTLYAACRFSGCPNRMRPDDYIAALERTGWTDPHLYPRRVLDPAYVARVEPSLASRFRGDPEHLGWLSIVLCARFAGGSPR